MPELPEVETSRRGIAPALLNQQFSHAVVRQPKLRWQVPANLSALIADQTVLGVHRRAKYILIELPAGHVLVHLGMSGRIKVVPQQTPLEKHDHIDLVLHNGLALRLNDARRFGSVLWQPHPLMAHPLLSRLGPEPLDAAFTGEHLHSAARGLKLAVKNFIMDQHQVVGVGNIYASEALFHAGIHPRRAAGRISLARYENLVNCIRSVLAAALNSGGTTLRDYRSPDGSPGYFAVALDVYGRAGQPCPRCTTAIARVVIGQRASYFCPQCQT